MSATLCTVCKRPMLDGEMVTGLSWDGQGGSHISCESTEASEPVLLTYDDCKLEVEQ